MICKTKKEKVIRVSDYIRSISLFFFICLDDKKNQRSKQTMNSTQKNSATNIYEWIDSFVIDVEFRVVGIV